MRIIFEKLKGLIKRNMPVFVIGGLTVLIFLGIIISSSRQQISKPNLIEVENDDLVAAHTYSKGPMNAKVQVVEFSCFGCPACKIFHPIMTKIYNDYPQDIRWSFRHLPLPQHEDSDSASIAAQAAGEQGKFWEYADILFENQPEFSGEKLSEYADLLGLDLEKFNSNVQNLTFKNIVNEDVLYAKKIGVNATPTFFVNGKQIVLNNPNDLRKAIEEALNLNKLNDTPQSTVSDQDKATTIDPELLNLYKSIDEKFGILEIKYIKEQGFLPKNSQAQAGQLVKWTNTMDADLTFVQLMPKFKEFSKPRIIKPGETMEFRLRLREKGLWTFKNEGDRDRGSILIMGIPVIYKDLVEKEID